MKIKKTLKIALSILTCAIIVGGVSACKHSSSSDPEQETGPKFIAHRGYSSAQVDNTEEAFQAAAEMGFYGIETDIRKTKDGYFVCSHDADVQYADGSTMTISQNDRATLRSRPLKNNKTRTDAYLCTFEDYLRACKSGNKVAVIEIKDHFTQKDISKILDIIDTEYDRKKVAFISFSYFQLILVKDADSTIELQYLSQTENDNNFDSCLKAGISIDVRQTILTEQLVQTFHDAGLKVNVWTVNDGVSLQSAYDLGVDYITTDVFSEE